ncbi:MAG TPA: glycoside hydrolase family 127 protein, partial [Candidatus Hydrogenedentes bacterium]|nr:glycoside hydrolase family 127 protein [Candidatus Hydrogenedentota bacterium]
MKTGACGWRAAGLLVALAAGAAAQEFSALDVRAVKVGGEAGRRIAVTVENNLLQLDMEKDFLKPFQKKAAPGGYVGLGKTLDAMARLAAHTGNADLTALHRKTVDAVLAAQEPDGYIGMMAPEARIGKLWDVHEMAYLLLGLCTDYAYFREKPSLDAAVRLAGYLREGLMRDPRPVLGGGELGPNMPDTGLEEALLALADQTGDPAWRDFAREYRPLTDWNRPIVLGRHGVVEGHAYAYVDKCLAQLRLDLTDHLPTLTGPSENVMHFLLREDGLVVSGSCGDHECWHD